MLELRAALEAELLEEALHGDVLLGDVRVDAGREVQVGPRDGGPRDAGADAVATQLWCNPELVEDKLSTDAVEMPISLAPVVRQSRNRSAIASRASGFVRSAPVAATSAIQTAIWVSSEYSPGA